MSGEAGPGFLGRLFGLYVSPGETFAQVLRRPAPWAPLAGFLALQLGFTALWLPRVEPREFVRAQLEEAGRWDRIPEDRRELVLERQDRLFGPFAFLGAGLGGVLWPLLAAGLLHFVFRFFYASDVTFSQSLVIVCFTFLAVGLVSMPLTLTTLALKDDWTLDPRDALQANLSALVDRQEVPRPLYSLLDSLDLFSFWNLTLLAIGFGLASRRSAAGAAAGVVVPWLLYVGGKVSLAALMV